MENYYFSMREKRTSTSSTHALLDKDEMID